LIKESDGRPEARMGRYIFATPIAADKYN